MISYGVLFENYVLRDFIKKSLLENFEKTMEYNFTSHRPPVHLGEQYPAPIIKDECQ